VHDERIHSTDAKDGGDLAGPERETIGIHGAQLVADRGDMVDKPEIFASEHMRRRSWVDVQAGKWEDAGAAPLVNGGLDFRSPHQICFVWCGRAVFRRSDIVIGAADLVLRAVAALGEILVTTNVSAFAGVTALAGLGVTATRRTTTWTGHFEYAHKKTGIKRQKENDELDRLDRARDR
jgi:hypothetical protein